MANVYEMVTERIVAEMEKGIIPWQKPWHGTADAAISYSTRRPYSLINQMLLGRPGEWLTWNQVKAQGGNVKKGAKAGMVVFFKWIVPKETLKGLDGKELTEEEQKKMSVPILRYYNVFHISDCEGIESKIEEKPVKVANPIEEAEKVVDDYAGRTGLTISQQKGDKAYYAQAFDEVVVPLMSQFGSAEAFYSTLFHECVHSTGHEKRLNRPTLTEYDGFGGQNYSREELVAEIGSAMVCNRIGIETEKAFKNSVAYLQSWLRALKNDQKMIVWAASRAEAAAKLILNEQG